MKTEINIKIDLARVNSLLEELNEIARDVCHYEYGLPIVDENSKARLQLAVIRWYAESTKTERQK